MSTKVGFIGVGNIGKPMAKNVIKGGYDMAVFDINQAAVAELIELGAQAMPTPAAVAAASDVTITMVPDAPDVEKAALGPGGVVEGIREGCIYMDMSTIDPGTTRRVGAEIAKKGARMIDAPVGRTVEQAKTGQLLIMIGGENEDVERVRPILQCMGDTLLHCGGLGNGVTVKLVNNYLSAGIVALHSEALSFGIKAGLTLEQIMDVVGGTFAGSRALMEMLPNKAFSGDFSPGFMSRLSHKDQRLALTLAKEQGVAAPVGEGVYQTLEKTIAAGYAEDDSTSMIRMAEEAAGIKIRLKR